MNTSMTELRWFLKTCVLVLRTKVTSALEGFKNVTKKSHVVLVAIDMKGLKLELHSPLTNSSGSSPGPNSPSSS